jgi:hypothetical protein
MPGSSDYNVLLKATIQKITQADLDKATAGLKVNVSSKGAETLNKQFKNVESTNKNILTDLSKNAGKVAQWGIATSLVYGSLQEIRKALEYIVDLNKELTNIRIVTGMDANQVTELSNGYNQLAKEMGATTLEVAEGSLEWFNL